MKLKDVDGAVTLDDVAAALGVTRQGAHVIERRALAKCARWCRARGLSLADLLPDNGAALGNIEANHEITPQCRR